MFFRLITIQAFLLLTAAEMLAQHSSTRPEVPVVRSLPRLFPRFSGAAKVDPQEIRGSARWTEDAENPPVSARTAISLATQEIKRFDKTLDYDRAKNRWRFHSVELIPPRRYGNWYWRARFDFVDVTTLGDSMPEQVWIPVSMNGTAVELRLPKPPEDMDPEGIDEFDSRPNESSRSNDKAR
jgi:hypothetical protein